MKLTKKQEDEVKSIIWHGAIAVIGIVATTAAKALMAAGGLKHFEGHHPTKPEPKRALPRKPRVKHLRKKRRAAITPQRMKQQNGDVSNGHHKKGTDSHE